MAPIAGPSNPRKRTQKQRESLPGPSAPSESFGALDLSNGVEEQPEVDEDYDTTGDEEDEEFPEIDAGSYDGDSGSNSDEDEDDEDLSENEQILRELAEEEELERELADSSESSFSDSEVDENDPDALDHAIRKATRKPNEDFDGTVDIDQAALNVNEKNKLVGFDTRSYRDKARIGRSEVTGQERWTWDNIEPGWESDEGPDEGPNRVGNIPAYFYDGMPHVGYTIDGKKIARPAKGDELDKFLANIEDPAAW
jgi:ribosome biogenesis protein ERB1